MYATSKHFGEGGQAPNLKRGCDSDVTATCSCQSSLMLQSITNLLMIKMH